VTDAGPCDLYEDTWGTSFKSTVGGYFDDLNGKCGWGIFAKNPSENPEKCSYAYKDPTCRESCRVTEGIYWAITSYLGGQFYSERAQLISNEWLLHAPDSDMTPSDESYGTLQSKAEALYNLLKDSTWVPTLLPDGNYLSTPTGTDVSCDLAIIL
jgi:hypothetical protein